MSDKIKVIVCPAQAEPYLKEIPNTLEACQKMVGGYIEPVRMTNDAVIICNEEGWIRSMPANMSAPMGGLYGDLFICGEDGEEFADVPAEYQDWLLEQCRSRWQKNGGVSKHGQYA